MKMPIIATTVSCSTVLKYVFYDMQQNKGTANDKIPPVVLDGDREEKCVCLMFVGWIEWSVATRRERG